MAQGDVTMFQEHLGSLGLKEFNYNTDAYYIGLIKSAANGGADPATADADPGWVAGRTTNFLDSEVTPGGNYSTGGSDITNLYSEAAGVATFSASNQAPYVASNASNATNARWGIIYNFTDTNKKAIGFIDLGSDFDMQTGDLNITWNASGIFTFTLA